VGLAPGPIPSWEKDEVGWIKDYSAHLFSSFPLKPGIEEGMVKKQSGAGTTGERSVTLERAVRLYRLLELLTAGPQTRGLLMRRLKLDVRGFYRDLEMLRSAGISVRMQNRRYSVEEVEKAINRLPMPDPHLTLGEARQLAKGRTRAHRQLQGLLTQIMEKKIRRANSA